MSVEAEIKIKKFVDNSYSIIDHLLTNKMKGKKKIEYESPQKIICEGIQISKLKEKLVATCQKCYPLFLFFLFLSFIFFLLRCVIKIMDLNLS